MSLQFEICIKGEFDPRWSQWFNDLEITTQGWDQGSSQTILRCSHMDQAKLRGVLNTIWDLNMEVISVQRLFEAPAQEAASGEWIAGPETETAAKVGGS